MKTYFSFNNTVLLYSVLEHSHSLFYFKENEDEDSASESEEEMQLVIEVSRNEELDDGPPGDCIPNSTSAAEYDVLQRYTNAKIHPPEMRCQCNCRLWDGKPCI